MGVLGPEMHGQFPPLHTQLRSQDDTANPSTRCRPQELGRPAEAAHTAHGQALGARFHGTEDTLLTPGGEGDEHILADGDPPLPLSPKEGSPQMSELVSPKATTPNSVTTSL